MRYISCKLDDLKKIVLPIGYEGENEHTRVQVDAGDVFKEYPAAVPSLKVHGPGGTIYPAEVTRDGKNVIWDIKASDCAADGSGEAQFTFTLNNVIVKSCIAKIKVYRSIVGGSTPPDPVQDWIDDAEEVLDDLAAMDNIAKTAEAGDVGKALSPKTVVDGVVTEWQYVEPGAGTEDYTDLENKPQIGGVTLSGDKSLHDLGIAAESAIPDVSGKANLSVVAPAFVQETANDAGSLVTYTDGVVYVLPEGHTAGTTWANTQKTATNIAEQQRLLLNKIAPLTPAAVAGDVGKYMKVKTVVDGSVTEYEFDIPSGGGLDDGAVTWPKLSQSVEEYIKITTESDTAVNFNNLDEMTKLIVSGNSLAFGNVLLCDKRNILPSYPQYTRTHGTQDLTAVFNGRFVTVSGTNTSSSYATLRPYADWINVQDFESGDYKLIVKQIADYTANETLYVNFEIKGTSGSKLLRSAYIGRTATSPSWDVTIDTGYTGDVSFNINVPPGFDGTTKFWFGLFKKPYTITDTEETVEDGETVEITIDPSDYANGIDSMQHKAIAEYHPAIQKYVDNLQINIDEELTYITPEAFGAVGNGVADDTTALQNCINYAITAGKVVRGFGIYKTTSSLTIDTDNSEIYLYCIAYEGNSYAVRIGGRYNLFTFGTIIASTSGAGCIELFTTTQSHHDTNRNVIRGISLEASGKCVYVNVSSGYYILYNVFDVKSMASTASDCIEAYGNMGELTIYNTWFRCPSGWCFNGTSVRLINCTIEANAYGGVYASHAVIQNCRARELMDALMPGNPHYGTCSGILFKQKATTTGFNTKIEIDDIVYYDAIDLSDAVVASTGDGAASTNNAQFGVVNCPIIRGDLNYRYGMFTLGSRMILHGKDKICVPQFRSKCTVLTTTIDMRDSNTNAGKLFYPTDFVIGVDESTIYLSPSYCAEGYSEFTVDMSTYKTTIYDRRGNVLFDPANYTTGVYKFTAIVDHTIDDTYQTAHSSQYIYPVNSGYCDAWTIEKIS